MMFDVRQSHKWKMIPSTRSEIKWSMNVRENKHTATLFNKRYQNIDTGKYDTDKLSTISSYSLGQIVRSYGYDDNYNGYTINDNDFDNCYLLMHKINKFVPKDNDFDKECEINKVESVVNKTKTEEEINIEIEIIRAKQEKIEEEIRYQEYVKRREKELAIIARMQEERDKCGQYIITFSGRKRVR